MGVFDKIKSTVLTEYKADTKDMRAELKKLSGEELKRHKALIDQTEAQNKKLDGQIAMWGKVAAGVGGAVVAYQVLSDGLDVYQRNSRLAAATVGLDLKGLQKATNGLVEETRLLEFASKAMNGTFKLSQQEMEQALQGALALRKTLGVELPDAMKAMQKAITEGTTEPLKELGLVIKGSENDTQEGLNAALAALNGEAEKVGGNFALAGDGITVAKTQMSDAADSIKDSLGRIAAALLPVIEGFATMLGYIAQIGGGESATNVANMQGSLIAARKAMDVTRESKRFSGLKRGDMMAEKAGLAILRAQGFKGVESIAQFEQMIIDAQQGGPTFGPDFPAAPAVTGGKSKSKGTRVKVPGGLSSSDNTDLINARLATMELERQARQVSGLSGIDGDTSGIGDTGALMSKLADDFDRMAAIEARAQKQGERASLISGLLGTPSEIDAMALSINGLTSGFDSLGRAFGEGVDALITGSASFADAFKGAIGESLRSMAVEMSISALKHTAYGLASLAFMDGRGAAAHFAAAGAFGIGALAAGKGAQLLGAGQSQAPAPRTAGSAGVGASGGASDSGGKGSTQVFIVGNDFAGLPARQRESQWRQISRSAGVTIEGDVVLDG